MARFLAPDVVEKLLAGNDAAAELPDRAAGLDRLFTAMSAPGPVGDPVEEEDAVAKIAAAIRNSPTVLATYRESRSRRSLVSVKAASIAAAVVLLGSTAAAAATGSLPDGAQRFFSTALSHVDITIPHPAAHVSPASPGANGGPAARSTNAHGTNPTANAKRTEHGPGAVRPGNSANAPGHTGSVPKTSPASGASTTTTTVPAERGSKPVHGSGPPVTTPSPRGNANGTGNATEPNGGTGKSGAVVGKAIGTTNTAPPRSPNASSNPSSNPDVQKNNPRGNS